MTNQTEMRTAYIFFWDGGGDYLCRECAIKEAERVGLVWNNPNTNNFTEENENGESIAAELWGNSETDTPQACECGQWLRVALTPDGIDYIKERLNEWPSFLLDYYGIKGK